MKVEIENIKHLQTHFQQEISLLKSLARTGRDIAGGLDGIETYFRRTFPAWFVYRGGSHVSLHASQDDDRRIVIATE